MITFTFTSSTDKGYRLTEVAGGKESQAEGEKSRVSFCPPSMKLFP